MPPPDAPQLASLMLVWSSVRARREGRGRPHSIGELRPSGHAGLRLTVTGCGFGCRTAAQWQPQDLAVERHSAAIEGDLITDAHDPGGFDPIAIHMHAAAGNSLTGQAARLVQADKEQPAVDPHGFIVRCLSRRAHADSIVAATRDLRYCTVQKQ